MPDSDNIQGPGLPPLEVFVVNYAGGDKLLKCVESLLASDHPSLRVRVIDNPPRDPIIGTIKEQFPQVEIIESSTNVGYAGAMHIAAKECQSKQLVICNNDLVFDPNCLAKLAAAHRESGAAAVSARVINPNEGSLESEYNATLNPLFFLIHGVFTDRSRAVYPSGACFLIERDALIDYLPPEEFFLYYEDVFIGMSLRMSGCQVVQVNDAVVHHDHGYSVSKISPLRLTFCRERNRHVCMFTFFTMGTIFKLALLIPLTLVYTLCKALRRKASFGGATLGWIHASFSWNYIRRLRKRTTQHGGKGELICAEHFTSRLLPDDARAARIINRLSRFVFKLLRMRTMD